DVSAGLVLDPGDGQTPVHQGPEGGFTLVEFLLEFGSQCEVVDHRISTLCGRMEFWGVISQAYAICAGRTRRFTPDNPRFLPDEPRSDPLGGWQIGDGRPAWRRWLPEVRSSRAESCGSSFLHQGSLEHRHDAGTNFSGHAVRSEQDRPGAAKSF